MQVIVPRLSGILVDNISLKFMTRGSRVSATAVFRFSMTGCQQEQERLLIEDYM